MNVAVVLIGPPGAGKSSVLEALSTSLEIDQIPFGAIETEQLTWGWPWLGPHQWMPVLAGVVQLQREAGRAAFLVVATTETDEELRAVVDAIGADRTIVVCLTAPPELAAQRVADREPDSWPGKRALVEHARQLASVIPSLPGIDATIPTAGREPSDVAAEVRRLLVASGILGPG